MKASPVDKPAQSKRCSSNRSKSKGGTKDRYLSSFEQMHAVESDSHACVREQEHFLRVYVANGGGVCDERHLHAAASRARSPERYAVARRTHQPLNGGAVNAALAAQDVGGGRFKCIVCARGACLLGHYRQRCGRCLDNVSGAMNQDNAQLLRAPA